MGTVRQAIKRDARTALKNRTGTAALITFFLLAVSFVVGLFEGVVPLMLGAPTFFQNLAESATPWEAALSSAPWFLLFAALMALVSLIFMAPMSVGAADWFISCTDGQENGAAHIFWPFGCKKFWGSLVLFIVTYIISLFWARSETAITELGKKYDRLARSVAMNILHDRLDTEECMNDSYLGMWNSLPPEKPQILPAFFTAITRNLALKLYRYKSASKRNAIMEELTDYVTSVPSPEEEINYAADIISYFLSTYDKPSRVLFMRRYYLGESIADAAKAVGMTENHAGVKLSRMRAKLKKILEEEGITV